MNMSSLALLLLVSSAAVVNATCAFTSDSPVDSTAFTAPTDCTSSSDAATATTTCVYDTCVTAGFVMLASNTYTCAADDSWTAPGTANTCELGCAALSEASLADDYPITATTGVVTTMECADGYIQVNTTMDVTATCTASSESVGVFAITDDDGKCVSGCAALADEEFVQFTTASLALSTGTSLADATAGDTLVCASGYIQVDEAVNVTATCTSGTADTNGTWTITADDGACVFGCPSISSGTWTAYNSTQTALATSTTLPGATVTTVNSCNTGYSQANATLDMTFTCASNTTGTLGSYTVTNGCVSDASDSSAASSVAPVFALGALLMARLL